MCIFLSLSLVPFCGGKDWMSAATASAEGDRWNAGGASAGR